MLAVDMDTDTTPSASATTINSNLDYNRMRSPSSASDCTPATSTGFLVPSVDCSSCEILNRDIETLKKRFNLQTRLLNELRKKHRNALKKIRKMCKEQVKFGSAVGKFLNIDQRKSLCKASNRGSKWGSSTIKTSLHLYFACGPTGYSALLHQKYPLPSLRTLRRSIQFVKFESGILTEVFQFLALKVHDMNAQERECCLTLDEMSITASVDFDNRSGNLIGDVTLPGHTGIATHSLVFMLGGITTRWKQTVAYYFTGNSTDGSVFSTIVFEIIKRCHDIGINVAAVTSDMGSANRAMWKKLGIVCGKKSSHN
jgi:Transposase protein